jgi:hypothetical protein
MPQPSSAADQPPTADPHAQLRRASAARKAATLARLQAGLELLAAQQRQVSLETIREVTQLHPRTITRNPAAYALFRSRSTRLQEEGARRRLGKRPRGSDETRPARRGDAEAPAPATPGARDPLESYSRVRLIRKIHRLEAALAARAEHDSQHSTLLQEHTRCALTIERLEGEVQELATYRAMLGQLRSKLRLEEYDRNG